MMRLAGGRRACRASWDGTEIFRYVYQPPEAQDESPRPYFHPVRTLRGDLVSCYRPRDHVWHKGIAWSLPNVGCANFWGGVTYRRGQGYVQLPNNGRMRHERFRVAGAGGASVALEEDLSWVTEQGRTWFAERRHITARVLPDAGAWVLEFATSMRNVSGGDITIGSPTTEGRDNAGYGGLFWRGPRSFTGGRVMTGDGDGGDEYMGWRGPWMGFAGGPATVVMRDHPGNPGYPCRWFVRSRPFACLCPAPFFSAEHTVPAGQALALRYHMAVAVGDLSGAACAGLAGAGLAGAGLAGAGLAGDGLAGGPWPVSGDG